MPKNEKTEKGPLCYENRKILERTAVRTVGFSPLSKYLGHMRELSENEPCSKTANSFSVVPALNSFLEFSVELKSNPFLPT